MLCYWGAYQNVGSVINLLYPRTDFDLIAIRHGYATNNQSGGGGQYAIVPATGVGEIAEDPFGLTGTLNGNIYNITMYWSSLTQLKIQYNYSYTSKTSPGGTIRSILGFKLGAANHGNP